jgi:hypothetical protein
LPLRRQRVQTFSVSLEDPTMARTLWMFGFHVRRTLLFEWLTLLPVTVPFPHMSHLRAMVFP